MDRQSLELRSRTSKHFLNRQDDEYPTGSLNGRVIIDHAIQPNDTLNSIALQYSVQVAEIKRVNGLVTDQEMFGFKFIRVPVSPHSSHVIHNMASSSSMTTPYNKAIINGFPVSMPTSTAHVFDTMQGLETSVTFNKNNLNSNLHSEKTPLLEDQSDESSEYQDESSDVELVTDDQHDSSHGRKKKRKKTKHAIENLLEKADATVAAVRENLSERSPNLEHGRGFHFIDATAPDNTSKGIWLLVASVVFMFVVVPLILTLMEEKSEEEQILLHSHNQHNRHYLHQEDEAV